jgi:hypothetical protein
LHLPVRLIQLYAQLGLLLQEFFEFLHVATQQTILRLSLSLEGLEIFFLSLVLSLKIRDSLFELVHLYLVFKLKSLDLISENMYLFVFIVDCEVDSLIRIYLKHLDPFLGLS